MKCDLQLVINTFLSNTIQCGVVLCHTSPRLIKFIHEVHLVYPLSEFKQVSVIIYAVMS